MSKIRIDKLIDDPMWSFSAYVDDEYAGKLTCVLQGERDLLFSDILVLDGTQAMIKLPFWKRLCGMKNEAHDFQRKNVGTTLIQELLVVSKQRGIRRIYGSIVQKDIEMNPKLLTWYEKRGFKIIQADVENLGNAIKKIEKWL